MLRSIMTSHISRDDLQILSLQVNGTLLGHLDTEHANNRVISGNREVHLACGFYAGGTERTERQYIQEQIRLFNLLFADLQTLGLAALPALAEKYRPEAAFLCLASAEMVLIWQDRQKGVYLLRESKLYRMQPCPRPENLWPQDWMLYGDFYAFAPKEEDLLIFLTPDFIDRFKAEQLEETFSTKQQVFSMMAQLNKLGKTYGFDFEQSWFALEIQRLEVNRIYKGHARENLSEEVRRIARSENFAKAIPKSKVSHIIHGQDLILPKMPRPRRIERRVAPPAAPPAKFRLGDWQRSRQQAEKISVINEDAKKRREATLQAYESRRDPLDPYFERVREFSFAPIQNRWKHRLGRIFNLWPEQPLFSKLFSTALLLLCVLLLALVLRWLLTDKPATETTESQPVVSTLPELPQADALVQAPSATNLEISIIVKANNLQIRQSKDPSSALIASVKRGETVLQLAPAEDGWVYVRNADGVEGYVYEEYLLPDESFP